jgi:DNA gyrase subunit A
MSDNEMAENEDTGFGAGEKILEQDIQGELNESYLTYAMSVIIQRALPDIRDGLKPSQRRILVAMRDLNLGPRSAHRKCAAIVGQTMMSYHPHGDGAIYPTLVRMAQGFNTRYPLVDSQGNFGSIDGDPPAAMRYTEARMTEGTVQLMADIDKETVDHQKTFDNRLDEPSVLPAAFPNLLCNGSTGIAVGMATSMPPHNLGEVCSGLRALIANPDISVEELMEHIPGPDFPTGAEICGRSGIRQAYRTGRGLIKVRSTYHIEEGKNKDSVVFTEIPYQENKVSIIEKISECVKDGRIQEIADVRDESDKDIRLVIELKMSASPDVVVNQLFKFTQLSATFSIINIALLRGRPETLGLKELLVEYKRHRMEIIRRRTRYLLRKAEERAHIVEGLLKALDIIDEVIALIRSSQTDDEAQSRLMTEHGFTEIQAHQILVMQLRRLTGLERQKLQDELDQLHEAIAGYRAILASEKLVLEMIVEELAEAEKKLGDPRRTQIVEEAEDYTDEDLIPEEQVAVTITREGYVKRTPLKTYRSQGRGGRGVTGGSNKEGDFVKNLFAASTHDYILLFTNMGRAYWLKVFELPNMGRTAKGRPIINFLQLAPGETVSQQLRVDQFDAERFVLFATRQGRTKKVSLDQFSRPKKKGIIAIKLNKGDSLIGASLCSPGQEVVLGTRGGMAIRFDEQDVRPMGRAAAGVGGIGLREEDEVVDMAILDPSQEGITLLTACSNGFGKRTRFQDYRRQKRNGSGIISIKTSERNGPVVGLKAVREEDDVVLMSQEGLVMRMQATDISLMGRATQGVKMMNLKEGDALASLERVAQAEDVEEEEVSTGGVEQGAEDIEPADSE